MTWHKKDTSWDDDKWELYHTDVDTTQCDDLAAENPEKLAELMALWHTEAEKYNVLPLDHRRYERAADPGGPVAAIAKDAYTFYPGTSNLHPMAGPQLNGREHTITAYVTIPPDLAEGVLACFGGQFGGWTLLMKDGKLHYVHNYLKLEEYQLASPDPIAPGEQTLSVGFDPTGKNLKPDFSTGNVVLAVDGQQVAELPDIKTAAMYSAVTGYGLLIGRNTGTPVCEQYELPFAFCGELAKVVIELGGDSDVDYEAGIRIAMHQD